MRTKTLGWLRGWMGVAALIGMSAASIQAAPVPKVASAPTIGAATVKPTSVAPGKPFKVTFVWRAVPLDRDYSVFVHFVNRAGTTVFQGDHQPSVATSKWSGMVRYTRTFDAPGTAADGPYRIVAGLYAARANGEGWENHALVAGKGVTASEGNRYDIGVIRFDKNAPPPPLDSAGPVTLNLKDYKITFADEFNDLSVSPWGPDTRWIAHTPYAGDFGDARFADPTDGFPFTINKGVLRIEAKKDGDVWKAGLLSSIDPKGKGFSQRYGYFEMRARFPKGAGNWPAFWLVTTDKILNPKTTRTGIEVDVVEQYGHAPQSLHTTLHWWPNNGEQHRGVGEAFVVADMTEGFHRYGFLWNKDQMIWYFDGVELWRQPTPPEAHTPMYLLVDLALGGGWPIAETPNPSHMFVDYVHAYARDEPSAKRAVK